MKDFRYRRFLTVLLSIVLVLPLINMPVYAMNGNDEGETIIVGVPADRCPIFYIDEDNGENTGIGIDLMRYAAANAGYTVEFKTIEEDTLKDALDNETYDLVMPFGSAILSASGQQILVSDNMMKTPFTLVTDSDRKMPPLGSLKVGMLSSLRGGADTVKQLYPGIEIKMFDTMSECVLELRSGEVDALLHNSYVWSYILQKPGYSDLVMQPYAMFSMDFRAGAVDTPKSREIIENLNRGIATISDTRRQAFVLDYTSRPLYHYSFSDYIYKYGLIIIFAIFLFILLIIITIQGYRGIRREQKEKMEHLIDYDLLTGVYSMTGFRKRVTEILHSNYDIPYMLVFFNIKNFKFINDSLGRNGGDDLLRFWADKTMATLSDKEAMCRIEADRFAVLRRSGGEKQLLSDEHDVIDAVRNYFINLDKENRVQICGGIYVLTPDDYINADIDKMIDYARVAEKKVHDIRSDGYEFYNPEQWEKGKHIAEVINQLPVALKAGDIQVWYQPQVDYDSGKITGAEALCRWKHNELGWLPPSGFIPILEDSGLIYNLDSYVWDKVCQDLHRWNQQGMHRYVSVNVSRCDICDDRDLCKHFRDLIKTYDLTPDQLRIEVTESAFAEDFDLLIQTTDKLRTYGFKVEMDDFGSGYSSLHMLKEVMVDRIKLDLRFLTDAGDRKKGRIIVGYIIRMIKALGMDIITEGVETEKQAEFLRGKGGSEMQGYYFFKPMPAEEFEKIKSFEPKRNES